MLGYLFPGLTSGVRPLTIARWGSKETGAGRSPGRAKSIRDPLGQQEAKAKLGKGSEKWASRAAASTSGLAEILSPHPDAIRRRKEAESRQALRMRELEELTKKTTSGGIEELRNVTRVESVTAYQEVVKALRQTGKQLIVHYKSTSCQSCLRLEYRLKCAAGKMPDVLFVIVDLGDGDGELAEHCKQLGINTVPYFHTYAAGEIAVEGKWKDIPLLAAYGSPQDARTCTVGSFRRCKKNEVIPQIQTKSSRTADAVENSKSAPSGFEVLRRAKLI